MTEKQLDCPQILCPAIDQRSLGSSERVRAIERGIKPYSGNPLINNPGILAPG
jgi:hypothetical protein